MSVLEELVRGEASDPHSLLGAHDAPGGVVLRVWRPEADTVTALPAGGPPVELERLHPAGVFAGVVAGASLPLDYRLEVAYPDGNRFVVRDPYAFVPTVGELDLHLAGEGRHEELYEKLGAHLRELDDVAGCSFAVWAPAARGVSVVGDFNAWDGRLHPMRALGASGIWELFVPDVPEGSRYKFEVHTPEGSVRMKADPFAFQAELPPETSSIVTRRRHRWRDERWLRGRAQAAQHRRPVSIYEVHLGSWRRDPADPERQLSFAQLAGELAAYATDMGFTHVELLPVLAHPFSGSWGYQVTGYFAPDARHGTPDEFSAFVDTLHEAGIGVILDWVPAHFPRDDWALARFDGTALYEHADPRRGEHPDWGTLVFNFARHEVRNFLLASALFWLREQHVDGLRVDAVASMLYRDYSRKEGEWVPNEHGGREDLDAVEFDKQLNEVVYPREPGTMSIAEESTSWPAVSRPTYAGGLGFGFKWNMGWMHDTLDYFQRDPVYRRYAHHQLTFSLMYAFSENFVLPLSHDEVVHGKRSILEKMPGDRWQQLANVRALYGYMWAHPGKKLLFMGSEFAQQREFSHERSLDWDLLADAGHAGVQSLVRDLNHAYRELPALWERDDDSDSFVWLEANDADRNVICFMRQGAQGTPPVVCVCNLAPVPREDYRVGLPLPGSWNERLNTDASLYGGSNVGNLGVVQAEPVPWHDQPHSAALTLPPLGVLWLAAAQ
ncbi:MAG: 1,4-alpha-glucan branching protein GlgB [Solirubrobacteraceae bacterium]